MTLDCMRGRACQTGNGGFLYCSTYTKPVRSEGCFCCLFQTKVAMTKSVVRVHEIQKGNPLFIGTNETLATHLSDNGDKTLA